MEKILHFPLIISPKFIKYSLKYNEELLMLSADIYEFKKKLLSTYQPP